MSTMKNSVMLIGHVTNMSDIIRPDIEGFNPTFNLVIREKVKTRDGFTTEITEVMCLVQSWREHLVNLLTSINEDYLIAIDGRLVIFEGDRCFIDIENILIIDKNN